MDEEARGLLFEHVDAFLAQLQPHLPDDWLGFLEKVWLCLTHCHLL